MAPHDTDKVDVLIRETMEQAPEVLHHIFALEGANEVLTGLQTEESKVAYLIHVIAIELYKADKAIAPTKISPGPNDIRFHLMRSRKFFKSFPYAISITDLGDLEDLYYAACAKLKELLQGVDLRLQNGFVAPVEIHFTYPAEPLASLGPINFGVFRDSLVAHWNFLFSDEITDFLDKGVKRKNMRDNKHEEQKQSTYHATKAQNDLDHVAHFHPGIRGAMEAHQISRHRLFEDELGWLKDIKGLQDVTHMSSGMIFGMLAEKYRPIVMDAGVAGASISRRSTPEAPRAVQEEEFSNHSYVSPYNLDERFKKLNNPNEPEMPCICDHDCICAPLCASDPSQNCLCEENSLFARVTEGMDIDDLDVPDLVRRERQGSESSGSSTASAGTVEPAAITDQSSDPANVAAGQAFTLANPAFMSSSTLDEEINAHARANMRAAEKLTNITKYNEHDPDKFKDAASIDWDDTASMTGSVTSTVPTMTSYWSDPMDDAASTTGTIKSMVPSEISVYSNASGLPDRDSSLAYQEALREPFAKQCEHPPKRTSVAERLLGRQSEKHLREKQQKAERAKIAKSAREAAQGKGSGVSFVTLKTILRRQSEARRSN